MCFQIRTGLYAVDQNKILAELLIKLQLKITDYIYFIQVLLDHQGDLMSPPLFFLSKLSHYFKPW